MIVPSETKAVAGQAPLSRDVAIYLDSSAFVKLYVPEAESERVDALLRGRRGLMLSDLTVTEALSAVARRMREGGLSTNIAVDIREAMLADAASDAFERLDLFSSVHREAERLLFNSATVPLRTLDALHIALALSGSATHVLTFDRHMQAAAAIVGLQVIDLSLHTRSS